MRKEQEQQALTDELIEFKILNRLKLSPGSTAKDIAVMEHLITAQAQRGLNRLLDSGRASKWVSSQGGTPLWCLPEHYLKLARRRETQLNPDADPALGAGRSRAWRPPVMEREVWQPKPWQVAREGAEDFRSMPSGGAR